MKAEGGEYAIQTEHGVFDLHEISKDKKDLEILSTLKEEIIREGKFPGPKSGKICLASIAAYIVYISSICEMLDNENDSGIVH
jgi:hypothetical protein